MQQNPASIHLTTTGEIKDETEREVDTDPDTMRKEKVQADVDGGSAESSKMVSSRSDWWFLQRLFSLSSSTPEL